MTPEIKAKELLDKYRTFIGVWSGGIDVENYNVRECATIAVKLLIRHLWTRAQYDHWGIYDVSPDATTDFWVSVLKEIERI